MKDVNKMILVGRLGANPESRETKSGFPVVHFRVATSRWTLPQGAEPGAERQEETEWHHIVAWGRQGETCAQYLKKGHLVYVEGSVRSHRYEAKDGAMRTAFEVHAEKVSFLGRPLRVAEPAEGMKASEEGAIDSHAVDSSTQATTGKQRGKAARAPQAAAASA